MCMHWWYLLPSNYVIVEYIFMSKAIAQTECTTLLTLVCNQSDIHIALGYYNIIAMPATKY